MTRGCVRLFLSGRGSCTFSGSLRADFRRRDLPFSPIALRAIFLPRILFIFFSSAFSPLSFPPHVDSLALALFSLDQARRARIYRHRVILNIGLRPCPWPRIGWRNDRAQRISHIAAGSFARSLAQLFANARWRNPQRSNGRSEIEAISTLYGARLSRFRSFLTPRVFADPADCYYRVLLLPRLSRINLRTHAAICTCARESSTSVSLRLADNI